MQDIRQSEKYAQFMEKIGWQVKECKTKKVKCKVFIKKFPLLGSFIKIQKINPPIPFLEIKKLAKKYRAFQIVIEPQRKLSRKAIKQLRKYGYKKAKSPFSPTKTLQINLKRKEEEIFKNFQKRTRWTIKKAKRNKVIFEKSNKIEDFIKLKSEKLEFLKYFLGRIQAKQIKALWQSFYPKTAVLLLAFCSNDPPLPRLRRAGLNHSNQPVAGVLLLFHNQVAYYWLAGSTEKGNKFGTPSLLVWEAIKLSKKKNCQIFDFEGIEDSRYKSTSSWAGFTRFKKSFGGKEIEYPEVLVKYRFPLS